MNRAVRYIWQGSVSGRDENRKPSGRVLDRLRASPQREEIIRRSIRYLRKAETIKPPREGRGLREDVGRLEKCDNW